MQRVPYIPADLPPNSSFFNPTLQTTLPYKTLQALEYYNPAGLRQHPRPEKYARRKTNVHFSEPLEADAANNARKAPPATNTIAQRAQRAQQPPTSLPPTLATSQMQFYPTPPPQPSIGQPPVTSNDAAPTRSPSPPSPPPQPLPPPTAKRTSKMCLKGICSVFCCPCTRYSSRRSIKGKGKGKDKASSTGHISPKSSSLPLQDFTPSTPSPSVPAATIDRPPTPHPFTAASRSLQASTHPNPRPRSYQAPVHPRLTLSTPLDLTPHCILCRQPICYNLKAAIVKPCCHWTCETCLYRALEKTLPGNAQTCPYPNCTSALRSFWTSDAYSLQDKVERFRAGLDASSLNSSRDGSMESLRDERDGLGIVREEEEGLESVGSEGKAKRDSGKGEGGQQKEADRASTSSSKKSVSWKLPDEEAAAGPLGEKAAGKKKVDELRGEMSAFKEREAGEGLKKKASVRFRERESGESSKKSDSVRFKGSEIRESEKEMGSDAPRISMPNFDTSMDASWLVAPPIF